MRVLVIGKTGQVGSELIRHAQDEADVFAPDRASLDIERPDQIRRALSDFRPDIVINTASFHNLPLCEKQADRAFAVNATATGDLASSSRDAGARFVTYSTDYVFSGDTGAPNCEDDPTGPLQAYGKSKRAGELAALAAYPSGTYVIRSCGLFGVSGAQSKGGNFVDKCIALARSGQLTTMTSEQIVSPTYADDLAIATLSLLAHREASPGIYHLVNEGTCSWYEFASAAIAMAGLKADITPVDRRGIDVAGFCRPIFSALANVKAKALGVTLPAWRDALERYIKRRYP